jgi:alkyl sulfatase BDS1-like metallo-beta-lactamase superfamily hydrolase
MMTSTLIAENTLDVNTALTYNFSDTNESFTIEVRNGIAQLHETALEGADVQINTSRQVLNQILMAGPNAQQVIGTNMQSGAFKFSNGDIQAFGLFMSYFDKSMSPEEIMLIVR